MFTINSIVDLRKNELKLEPGLEFNCIQGDSGAKYKIIFNFKQCINFNKISGILTFNLPDGSCLVDSITFNSPVKAHYYLKDEILSQAGNIQVSLSLIDENRFTIYTYFRINVKSSICEDPIDINDKDPTYLLLQSLLTEVKNLEVSIKDAENIRITNENLRIEGETLREQAENLRKEAEAIRINNENNRIQEWEEMKQEIIKKLSELENGKDAMINGYNVIELKGGNNIEIIQQDNILTVASKAFTWENF